MKIIPKELSVKLKEIGFDEVCSAVFRNNDIEYCAQFGEEKTGKKNSDFSMFVVNKERPNYWLSAPTYEQVKEWFMEKHLIFITVNCEKWLSEFMGEVETADGLSKLKTVNDYHEAFAMAIEEAIRLKILQE
jgi:hypothetical protein